MTGARHDGAGHALLDEMPLGVAVVDVDGIIRTINARLAEMVGLPEEQLVGRSMLDFVVPDDLGFAGEVLAAGLLYVDQVMGPVRVRYVDGVGRARFTEFWARNCVDVPGIEGYVLTLSEESVADKLSDAIRSIAAAQPVEVTLGHIAAAMTAHPLQGVGSLLVMRGDELVPIGPWPIDRSLVDARDRRSPWRSVVRHGDQRDFVGLHGLPDAVREAAERAGFSSVWVRPITAGDGIVAGALVVWRPGMGWPSPNQERRMADAVAIASLAFDQARTRASMEQAVFLDPLTGLGNRARLADLVREQHASHVSVLYVDLDGFKGVNDRYGHHVGDAVLAEVGMRLTGVVRTGDEVIRVGGDEFVLFCGSAVDPDDVAALADRIVRRLAEPYDVPASIHGGGDVVTVSLSASVGLGSPEGGRSLAERISAADQAMYEAKFGGKGCWRWSGAMPRT